MVVPQDPPPRLARVRRAEAPQRVGQVVEDDPRLAHHAPLVLQHRHLGHGVQRDELRAAVGALEEVDPDGLPVGPGQLQRQRRLVGVAGLGEAVEAVFAHSALPMISFMISFVPP